MALALAPVLFVLPWGPTSLGHLHDSASTSTFSGIVKKMWILRSGRTGDSILAEQFGTSHLTFLDLAFPTQKVAG